MPLSDEEARLLAQLEESLAAEDPHLASTLRGSTIAARARRLMVLAVVVFFAGVAVLIAGAVAEMVVLGVVGFVVMLGAVYLFARTWRRSHLGGSRPVASEASAPKAAKRSFVERMEQRWNKRQDDQGY